MKAWMDTIDELDNVLETNCRSFNGP